MRYDNILQTVGSTPVVRINKLCERSVELFAKVESFNPMGSVKDRLAVGVIEDAERSGALKPGQTVIEATSGNTGIGLAMVCAAKGYPLVVTMAENFSLERRKMLRFLGAKVVLTPASEKGSGMLAKAVELSEKHGWFLSRQFENESNADVHSRTTAREILSDFDDGLDYFVTGYGTGGTLKGVARVLKEESPDTCVIVCEPDNAPLLGSGISQGGGSHPMFRPHLMQGWTPDFISKLTGDASDLVDGIIAVNGQYALECSQRLAKEEGIFVGISAGATLAAALTLAENAPEGSRILCTLPDTGERYLSTPLFEGIEADMNADEMEISQSTPLARFDAPPPCEGNEDEEQQNSAPEPPSTFIAGSEKGREFVNEVVSSTEEPVVMFALEWCEFCWAVRKLFADRNIPYRSIDLDSVVYQTDNLGGEIRAALTERTGMQTIPQVFVGGKFVGGCTEVFDAYREEQLQGLLANAEVSYDRNDEVDPYQFMPGWLHAR
ncbi:MAG: cysteine synthase A [Pseudomonadales bacterium]|nr:cysteine synthase A [Pseudomonadales bacterium]